MLPCAKARCYMWREERARSIVPLRGGKWWDELACGEVVEGAEAAGELVGAQAAVAVEGAHKFDGVAVRLQ
jgi:hypothetical protein